MNEAAPHLANQDDGNHAAVGEALSPFAARALLAYQCLPRERLGRMPSLRSLEIRYALPRSSLSRIFSGDHQGVAVDTVGRLAAALGVTIEWLAAGEGEGPAPSADGAPYGPLVTRRGGRMVGPPARLSTLGERVQYAVFVRGMSFNTLAKAMGKGAGYVSRLLSEERQPRTGSLVQLANALGVSTEWLLHGTGDPPAQIAGDGTPVPPKKGRLGLAPVQAQSETEHAQAQAPQSANTERAAVVAFIRGAAAVSANRAELLRLAASIAAGEHIDG